MDTIQDLQPAQKGETVMDKNVTFYFAPHQDDELTNLGAGIVRQLSAGDDVYVVLCTDGGASSVKRMLIDGGGCRWHGGCHHYPLDAAAFTAARDREYRESCRRMGVPADRVLISPLRSPDGGLSVEQAAKIILDALNRFCPDGRVATILPVYRCHQNPDHTAIGEAALQLHRQGRIPAPALFFEQLLCGKTPEGTGLERLDPTPEERARLLDAAAAYRIWSPETGFYAVGYHSVADEFDAFCSDPYGLLKYGDR